MTGFRERSIDFIHRTATGPIRKRIYLAPLFAGFFLGLILLAIGGSFYLDGVFGFSPFLSAPLRAAVSLPLLTGGVWLWLWSVLRFLRTKGTPIPIQPPPELVTDGPYAYSRNPMLTGIFLLLAGIGIFCGSVILTFVATPVFVFISILEIKYIEEPEIERRFGEAYSEYRRRTPLLIPRLRRTGRRRR